MAVNSDRKIGGVEDRLIWDLDAGAVLKAKQDIRMEDPPREQAFTEGREYPVVSMHPIADPPFVQLHNDQGRLHRMHAEHIRKWFERVNPNARR